MKFSPVVAALFLLASRINAFTGAKINPSLGIQDRRCMLGGQNGSSQGRTTLKLATDPNKIASLATASTEARGLAMDSIAAANLGYLGTPLGCAEIGASLYGSQMMYNPKDHTWINRDRFVLSCGYGSMFLYSWLHLAGFDLPLEELKNHHQRHSMTPAYPEFPTSEQNTPGVESTTGSPGQGVANAVGAAASAKMAAAVYNTNDHQIFDHHVYVLASNICLQEGVASEAASFAAHEKLDNLILLYDANEVNLDKMTEYIQSEDLIKRYDAFGWETFEIDGHDLVAVENVIVAAKDSNNGKPKFVKCNTIYGKGIEEICGTNTAHGSAGVPYVDKAKKNMGIQEGKKWYVSDSTRRFFAGVQLRNKTTYDEWQETYAAWKKANVDLAIQLENAVEDRIMSADDMINTIKPRDSRMVGLHAEATRVSGYFILQEISRLVPHYVSGCADLHGPTRTYINDGGNFGTSFDKKYDGKNLYFGKREHAMGGIISGFGYHGLFKISGCTYLVMADYFGAAIRLAALSELSRVSYVLTHDSVSLGSEGPTQQPVENLSCLRMIPNLDVYRPADYEETVAAMVSAVTRKEGPTALIFSFQNIDQNDSVDYMTRRAGALKGGYIAKKESTDLDLIILATGSEVPLALESAKNMSGTRVVSMPCMEAFERQSDDYKESVLPCSCTKRIAIEAGVTALWYKYASKVVGIDRFGFSALGNTVMKELGMTAENLSFEIASMSDRD